MSPKYEVYTDCSVSNLPFSVQQLNDALGMNAQRRILGIFLILPSAYNPSTAFECNHLRICVVREISRVNNQEQATSTQQLQQERPLGYSFLVFAAWGLFLECMNVCMGVKNDTLWSEIGSGFGKPGGTPPPRIHRGSPRDLNEVCLHWF